MPIRVETPVGEGWTYSLNLTDWQVETVFQQAAPQVPFVAGQTYTVYCRNVSQNLLAVAQTTFGQLTNQDTMNVVVRRGSPTQQGWTDFLVSLMGGVRLGNVPLTTLDYPTLVIGPGGRVMQRGGSVVVEEEGFVLRGHVRAVSATQPIRGRGSVDTHNCAKITGWGSNLNNPDDDCVIVIEDNGVIVARIVTFVERPDVRTYLNDEGASPAVTRTKLGFEWTRPTPLSDGATHTIEVYVEGAKANTFTYNVQAAIVCGTPPPAKTLVELIALGDASLREGTGGQYECMAKYSDNTTAFVTAQATSGLVGTGVSVNATHYLSVAGNATSGDDRQAVLTFTFGGKTVSKTIAILDVSTPAPTRISLALTGDGQLDEGKQIAHFMVATLSNGQTESVIGTDGQWSITGGNQSDVLDANGLQTALSDEVVGNGRTVTVHVQLGNLTAQKSVQVIDKTLPPVAVNRAPVVMHQLTDQVVTQAGDVVIVIPANSIEDPDGEVVTYGQLTLNTGGSLPNGLTYDALTRSLTVPANYPNGAGSEVVVRIGATDPGGLTGYMSFRVRGNRVATPPPSTNKLLAIDHAWTGDSPAQFAESNTAFVKTAFANGAEMAYEYPAQSSYLGNIPAQGKTAFAPMQLLTGDASGYQYGAGFAGVVHTATIYLRATDKPADVQVIAITNTAAAQPRTNRYTAP